MNFPKLRSDLPVSSGKNVFTAVAYAQHAQIHPRTARERLQQAACAGKVRRVRFQRKGRMYLGWEYITKKRVSK